MEGNLPEVDIYHRPPVLVGHSHVLVFESQLPIRSILISRPHMSRPHPERENRLLTRSICWHRAVGGNTRLTVLRTDVPDQDRMPVIIVSNMLIEGKGILMTVVEP